MPSGKDRPLLREGYQSARRGISVSRLRDISHGARRRQSDERGRKLKLDSQAWTEASRMKLELERLSEERREADSKALESTTPHASSAPQARRRSKSGFVRHGLFSYFGLALGGCSQHDGASLPVAPYPKLDTLLHIWREASRSTTRCSSAASYPRSNYVWRPLHSRPPREPTPPTATSM